MGRLNKVAFSVCHDEEKMMYQFEEDGQVVCSLETANSFVEEYN